MPDSPVYDVPSQRRYPPPGFGTYSLLLCFGEKKSELGHFGIFYGKGRKVGGGTAKDGLTEITESGIELGFRGFLTPDHSRVGLYWLLGLRFSLLSWWGTPTSEEIDFGEIIVHEGNGEVHSSSIDLGLGATLLRTPGIHFGIIATCGFRGLDTEKMSEMEKKLFDEHQWEFKLGLEASIPF